MGRSYGEVELELPQVSAGKDESVAAITHLLLEQGLEYHRSASYHKSLDSRSFAHRAPVVRPPGAAERSTSKSCGVRVMSESRKDSLLGELLAEFLGTLVLIALGDGVVAMVLLFGSGAAGETVNHEVVKGGYTNITLGWGLAVFMGICVAGRVSGAHLNPAVTLALAGFRGFPWRKVLPYSAAQVAGAFIGAALVYGNYYPAFHRLDPDLSSTAGVFTTFPTFPNDPAFGLLDQVIGTALLVGLIFAITDPRNRPVSEGWQPFAVGLVVVAIGVSWGGMHGYAINPARDFGPRLFTLAAGFRNTGFESRVFLVPIIGPLVGGLVGALIYDSLIRPFLPAEPVKNL
jgi:glycerol uptake facilitator